MIRRAEVADWERLRDVRLRALAADPHAFLESLEHARELPEAHWRDRATASETQVTFVEDRDGTFASMVAAFIGDDPETAYLVSMWVEPELRGTGVAVQLVEHVLGWAREHQRTRVVLSVERTSQLRGCMRSAASSRFGAAVRAKRGQPFLRIRAVTL